VQPLSKARVKVRSGSLAAATSIYLGVRFTSESCRDSRKAARPLRANNCREQVQQNFAYSITSSARAITEAGTDMPSALAVLRLMLM
jgi:hypothetical protein